MSLESDSTKNVACIQKTPNGRLLGVAIFMDAEIIEIEEVQHKKNRQKELLARFWDMGRTALVLLGALLKLRDWL